MQDIFFKKRMNFCLCVENDGNVFRYFVRSSVLNFVTDVLNVLVREDPKARELALMSCLPTKPEEGVE